MRVLLTAVFATSTMVLAACSGEGSETASASSVATPGAVPDFVSAVAAPGRDAKDIELDGSRQPAALLSFMGLEYGDKVADILAGGGYYSEIMGRVVGPEGSVTAFNTGTFSKTGDSLKKWKEITARQTNVTDRFISFPDFSPGTAQFDFAMLHLVFHDLYWENAKFEYARIDPDKFLASLYTAMKPGGTIAIVDHVGSGGNTREIVKKLHRIDPAVVKADMNRAGFVLEAQSNMFANPEDDISKLVFDPSVRGKTDRIVMRFRKPG